MDAALMPWSSVEKRKAYNEKYNALRRMRRAAKSFPRIWIDHLVIGEPEDCWPWQASTNRQGYPQVNIRGKVQRPHRLVAELVHGHIEGPVHHRCGNRLCLNPSHLEPVATDADHGLRHRHDRCKEGHLIVDFSTGFRRCRECHARKERERQRRLKASAR